MKVRTRVIRKIRFDLSQIEFDAVRNALYCGINSGEMVTENAILARDFLDALISDSELA